MHILSKDEIFRVSGGGVTPPFGFRVTDASTGGTCEFQVVDGANSMNFGISVNGKSVTIDATFNEAKNAVVFDWVNGSATGQINIPITWQTNSDGSFEVIARDFDFNVFDDTISH